MKTEVLEKTVTWSASLSGPTMPRNDIHMGFDRAPATATKAELFPNQTSWVSHRSPFYNACIRNYCSPCAEICKITFLHHICWQKFCCTSRSWLLWRSLNLLNGLLAIQMFKKRVAPAWPGYCFVHMLEQLSKSTPWNFAKLISFGFEDLHQVPMMRYLWIEVWTLSTFGYIVQISIASPMSNANKKHLNFVNSICLQPLNCQCTIHFQPYLQHLLLTCQFAFDSSKFCWDFILCDVHGAMFGEFIYLFDWRLVEIFGTRRENSKSICFKRNQCKTWVRR